MRYPPLLFILFTLSFCACRPEGSKTVIPLRLVKRLPNSLEYEKRPLTEKEKAIMTHFLRRAEIDYFRDSSDNLYVSDATYFTEGPKMYFWILSEALRDSLLTETNQEPASEKSAIHEP